MTTSEKIREYFHKEKIKTEEKDKEMFTTNIVKAIKNSYTIEEQIELIQAINSKFDKHISKVKDNITHDLKCIENYAKGSV